MYKSFWSVVSTDKIPFQIIFQSETLLKQISSQLCYSSTIAVHESAESETCECLLADGSSIRSIIIYLWKKTISVCTTTLFTYCHLALQNAQFKNVSNYTFCFM